MYEIEILTPSGTALKTLASFNKLSWGRAENTFGVLDVLFPYKQLNNMQITPTFFAVDQQLEVFRKGRLINETAYFLRMFELIETESRDWLCHVIGYDANYLLDSRIVADDAGETNAEITDNLDDMMKTIVDNELVSATDTDRNLSTLSVAGDLGDAPSETKAFSRRNVLKVLQDLAATSTDQGTYLAFDVVRTARNSFEFRTYTGQRGRDHTQDSGDVRHIGQAYGNLKKPRLVMFDRTEERNYAYAGGRGQATNRDVQTAEDTTRTGASPYNRREVFVDARNTGNTDAVDAKAQEAVEQHRPVRQITGDIVDTDGLRFNIDYGFGDLVTAEAFSYTADCHIEYIEGTFTPEADQKETIKASLRGDL
jgi:hypothetical protein